MKRSRVTTTSIGLLLLFLAAGTAQGQTLLIETTWGGAGSDVAEAVATSADGSSYVVGITDSFAVDQFGIPSARIFVVKFAADGSLTWQRIWNGTTIRGLGRPDVAVSSDGSAYVTGVTADNGNDAVLLEVRLERDAAVGKDLGRHLFRREPCRGDSFGRIGLYRRHGDKFRAELGRPVCRQVRLSRQPCVANDV